MSSIQEGMLPRGGNQDPVEDNNNGYARFRIVLSHGKPVDYVFLAMNHSYEDIIGIKAKTIIGKRYHHIFTDKNNIEFDSINNYYNVASTGISNRKHISE